ncbi:hypothetical protein QWY85_15435 [Neolewinella lacunae]|uniref:Uncharacterized protein n=1 Tax=Neolewinella lacunae TaxID=1517758 RepID=A0A923PMM0_9BACT|nr:hypothetical protein [Neolewinella lacunae]MBC6994069.1 hypothetical protein [Neolewinella lacunae]MDN3636060.1 hypothetical protein [Neolewinella lacunae]
MRFFLSLSLLFLSALAIAQAPSVFALEARAGESLNYEMDLNAGAPITDLSWAWNSSNACFVEPRKQYFTGNHVLFKTEIPTYSTMVIRLVPTDPSQNMSIYAYSGGGGALPPALASCVSCEADFYQDRPSRTRPNPDHTRSVELRAVTRPYPVTIGVVGADGLAEGTFTLEITVTKNR